MDKDLEKLVNQLKEVVSVIDKIEEIEKKVDLMLKAKPANKIEKVILFHWDDIAIEMGVAGLNYGVCKQLEIMADYFKQFRKPREKTFYYPLWDCLKNEIHVLSVPDHIFIDHPVFYDLGLLNMAYDYNRRLFKAALSPDNNIKEWKIVH